VTGVPIRTAPAPAIRRGFGAYGAVVSGLGAILLCALAVTGDPIPLGDWRFWLMGALVLVGELMPIDVPRRDGADRVAISTAFAFAMLLQFGLLPAVLAYAAASAIADVNARLSLVKVTFNAAQYGLSLAASALVLAALGHEAPIASIATALPAVLASGATFFLVNHVLAGVGVALIIGESPARYLLSDLPFQVLTAGFVLALSPVVVASSEASMALVPLALLPVLALYIGARRAALDTHRAFHDALTDLPNRLLLHERLDRALARARAEHEPLALLLVDLDDFKAVNDTLGHAYGDRLLGDVADRMRAALGRDDLLARLGGDEFAVLPAGACDAERGRVVAERLVAALEQPFEVDGILLDVRASVGLACFPDHGSAPDELLRGADVALYVAKAAQRPVEVYSAGKDHYTVDRLMLAAQLRRGIELGELVLEYQPKFPLRGGPAVGVEALARWEHPTLGRIGPDGFIPLAEQTGLISRVTDVVLRTAIAQCGAWQAEGLGLRVSVNVSPRNLLDPHLPGLIRMLLADAGVPPSRLQLEITESRAVPSGRVALGVLEELREMGVGLAIDDFGTGFSSLVQLQRLPVDEIKIDRSFVISMMTSDSDAMIVRSTIDLARNLGLVVTAEGVEDQATRRRLADMGCDLAQGYELCRPLPADRCAMAVREASFVLAPVSPIGSKVTT
jgi:diguanylate cyclase (GGDEF)-like protein